MPLKLCELVSLLLSALVMGMFFGPWVALSRSFHTLSPTSSSPSSTGWAGTSGR